MIITYLYLSPSPTQSDPMPLHGARTRGDRIPVLGASVAVLHGRFLFRPIATEAAALLPFNVNGDGCPERATPAFRTGTRLVSELTPHMEQSLSTNGHRGQRKEV